MAVLTLNAGSTSLKFAVFDGEHRLLHGAFEDIGTAPKARVSAAHGEALDPPAVTGTGHEAVLPALFNWVRHHLGSEALVAIGHRVVHGGDRFTGPVRIDADVLGAIEALTPLAPLHQPHAVAAIRASQAAEPGLAQVACFDTAFHASLPLVARAVPLPGRLGLRRYGFHGLSYQWIVSQLPPHLRAGRVLVAHLGGGASLCALRGGRSIETTMGTTPLDGLMMGTRCGTLDPGTVLTLLQHHNMRPEEVENLLYHESGLLGVSGVSDDIRILHDSTSASAAAAIDLFVYRIVQHAGALVAVLEGLEGLVFTGGIGEHDALLRARVCAHLSWLGIEIAPDAQAPGRISTAASRVEVHVIPANEEAVIAREVTETV